MQFIIIALYVVLSVSGVVCFKLGSMQNLSLTVTSSIFSLQISWLSIIGLFFYICSFLMYMGLVAKYNLSYLVPVVTGAVYILTLAASIFIFKEDLNVQQIIGSLLVFVGVLLINWPSR